MGTRTFEYNITFLDWASIIILLFADLTCLWHRESPALIALGVLLIIVTLRAADRCLHTKYLLTDKEIIIETGRFSRNKIVPFGDIKEVTTQPLAFRIGTIVVITKLDEAYTSLQPKEYSSFIHTLQKRLIPNNQR